MNNKKIPLRQCIACREMKPKTELIRIVKTSDGKIVVDPKGKLAGRGAYICKNVECLNLAKKKKSFERTFETKMSDELFDNIVKEIKICN